MIFRLFYLFIFITFLIIPFQSSASVASDTIIGVGNFYSYSFVDVISSINPSVKNFIDFYNPLLVRSVEVYMSLGNTMMTLSLMSIDGLRGIGNVTLSATSNLAGAALSSYESVGLLKQSFFETFYTTEF